jgi:hypothetical protein
MRRLNTDLVQTTLQETALQAIQEQPMKRAVFAVDATGLAPGAISTFFINRKRDRGKLDFLQPFFLLHLPDCNDYR